MRLLLCAGRQAWTHHAICMASHAWSEVWSILRPPSLCALWLVTAGQGAEWGAGGRKGGGAARRRGTVEEGGEGVRQPPGVHSRSRVIYNIYVYVYMYVICHAHDVPGLRGTMRRRVRPLSPARTRKSPQHSLNALPGKPAACALCSRARCRWRRRRASGWRRSARRRARDSRRPSGRWVCAPASPACAPDRPKCASAVSTYKKHK
jgi:hypothetical protein